MKVHNNVANSKLGTRRIYVVIRYAITNDDDDDDDDVDEKAKKPNRLIGMLKNVIYTDKWKFIPLQSQAIL